MTQAPVLSRYYTKTSGFRGFSAAFLKITAIVLMFADHASVAFNGQDMTVFRWVARIAFPIFAFLIAEGAVRTRSIPKYLLRLAVFAVISEFAFDLLLFGVPLEFSYQNVYFTLLLGLLSVWCLKLFKQKGLSALSVITTAVFMGAAYYINCDYGASGVFCIFMFYVCANKPTSVKLLGFGIGILSLSIYLDSGFIPMLNMAELPALFSLLFIMYYNGEKGKKLNKYFFYAFYPGHLFILWLITFIIEKFS